VRKSGDATDRQRQATNGSGPVGPAGSGPDRPVVVALSPANDLAAYCTRVPLQPGLSAKVALEVGDEDTAVAHRSGDVPVLATPRLIALCEQAALTAVSDRLPEGSTTVGMRVQLDHLAPTAVGCSVTAEATLEKVEGRRLTFTVSATDERGLVAAGKVTRVVVEVEQFLGKCH
jgi:predicted thioesterase